MAAAGPRFGTYFEEVKARGIDLVVLLDVSRSMQAEDVAPNRLRRAASDVRDLLPKLQGDRVGLVVFAGAPVVRVPLTTDQAFLRQALDSLDPDMGPSGGSALGDAIRKALEILPQDAQRDQALLLITDGEDHDSFPLEAARQAAQRNVKLFAVGLGDADQGARIPLRDADGNRSYLRHEGQEVWSKVNRQLLTALAMETGGAYVPAHTRTYDLGRVYEDHLARLTRGELQGEKQKRLRDQFPLFLGIGLALLLLEMAISSYPRSKGNPVAAKAKSSPAGQPASLARPPADDQPIGEPSHNAARF